MWWKIVAEDTAKCLFLFKLHFSVVKLESLRLFLRHASTIISTFSLPGKQRGAGGERKHFFTSSQSYLLSKFFQMCLLIWGITGSITLPLSSYFPSSLWKNKLQSEQTYWLAEWVHSTNRLYKKNYVQPTQQERMFVGKQRKKKEKKKTKKRKKKKKKCKNTTTNKSSNNALGKAAIAAILSFCCPKVEESSITQEQGLQSNLLQKVSDWLTITAKRSLDMERTASSMCQSRNQIIFWSVARLAVHNLCRPLFE